MLFVCSKALGINTRKVQSVEELATALSRSRMKNLSFTLELIDGNTGIGANLCARSASDACVRIAVAAVRIALVVNFASGQSDGIGRACDDAEVATFAALGVHDDCSMNFCHCY